MPLVIEAPETTQGVQQLPRDGAIPYTHSQHKSSSFFAGLRAVVASYIRVSPSFERPSGRQHPYAESSIDKLAREHPYMYIKSMSG